MSHNRKNIRVFISYSHDSSEHESWVLAFAKKLRKDRIDAWIDQFEVSPRMGWPRWMQSQIDEADFVLCICTKNYKNRFEGRVIENLGGGVIWEGIIFNQIMYEKSGINEKFIPVLPYENSDRVEIPQILRSYTFFNISNNYNALLSYLSGNKNFNKNLELAERKSRGLPAIEDLNEKVYIEELNKTKHDILSPYNSIIYFNPVISTKYGREVNQWNNKIFERISLIRESKRVFPMQPFIVLVETNTKETISVVARTTLDIEWTIPNGTTVVINEPIATVLYDKNFTQPLWIISRGVATGGILKYRPRIQDGIWKATSVFFENEKFEIVSEKVDEEAGLEYVSSPIAGIISDLIYDNKKSGTKISKDTVICNIWQGEKRYPVLLNKSCQLVQQLSFNNEAVHVGQPILKIRTSCPEIQLKLKPIRKADWDHQCFELLSPIWGNFFIGSNAEIKISPGQSINSNIILCKIKSDDLVVKISVDYSGKLLEIVPSENDRVEFGDCLMRFQMDLFCIRSPFIGTFFVNESPDSMPFVEIGQKVRKGDLVGVIENNKDRHYIESPFDGIIDSREVYNGSGIEYYQVLFFVRTL